MSVTSFIERAARLAGLADVEQADPVGGQVPVWDADAGRFEYGAPVLIRPKPGFHYAAAAGGTPSTLALDRLQLSPIFLPRSVTLDRIGCEVTTAAAAGGVFRPAIYADHEDFTFPGDLLLDPGVVATDTSGVKEITISLVVPAGVLWIGGVAQVTVTTLQMRVNNLPALGVGREAVVGGSQLTSYGVNGISGALPAAFSPAGIGEGAGARVSVRVA